MHKLNRHLMPSDEATAQTPCASDPERWFPVDQKPDPEAVAACWSCYFQRRCARRALAQPLPDHGIWGGYRLAPGRGLKRSRKQLAIVAGEAMGPPASPGAAVLQALENAAQRRGLRSGRIGQPGGGTQQACGAAALPERPHVLHCPILGQPGKCLLTTGSPHARRAATWLNAD